MNPLDLSPRLRKIVYITQWVVNLILGTAGVVLVALGESPLWFVATVAGFNFAWSYAGITAHSHTPTSEGADQ